MLTSTKRIINLKGIGFIQKDVIALRRYHAFKSAVSYFTSIKSRDNFEHLQR